MGHIKTLIIHPKDKSTDFLKPIYDSIYYKTIITSNLKKSEVNEEIKAHDRIIMLGHGCPYGLFSVGAFREVKNGLIIDPDTATLLQDKTNIFIWCNADQYVKEFDLHGFYSGMFISEVDEATMCGVYGVDQNMVNESNDAFARIMCDTINGTHDNMHKSVIQEYGELAKTNPVAYYNVNRIYVSQNGVNIING